MTLGEKLKELRKKFGLTQEELGSMMNVSRQAITKWENDNGIPDISNLVQLANFFEISVDYLLDEKKELPHLSLRISLDKKKYKNKLSSYAEILQEYFKEPWQLYNLTKIDKMGKLESLFNYITGGDYYLIKGVSDLSPNYLGVKNDIKVLINIKDWVLTVKELPSNTNIKKFTIDKVKFINAGKLKFGSENNE